MWKMHEIREIINLFEESLLQELEVECGEVDSKLTLKKQGRTVSAGIPIRSSINTVAFNPVAVPAAVQTISTEKKSTNQQVQRAAVERKMEQSKQADSTDPALVKIVSPMVGTFYRAPGENEAPFVNPGDQVQKNSVVCIVEAMKLFNEIEAEVKGEIVDVLVENGQLVEHGQPLFLIKPE